MVSNYATVSLIRDSLRPETYFENSNRLQLDVRRRGRNPLSLTLERRTVEGNVDAKTAVVCLCFDPVRVPAVDCLGRRR